MQLIFGLGNPGQEYENTYHNVGLLAVLSLAGKIEDLGSLKKEKHFWYRKSSDLILAGTDPEAKLYMNESGVVVEEALSYFKLSPNDLILAHDDSDLPLGTWKLESERGAAGHHGVESTMHVLGTNTFTRARIGIRPEEIEGVRRKAGEFVLKPISKKDQEVLEKVYAELGAKVLS
jgi:PTH1 family peptidyl-tRNA hydrolase